MQTMTLPKSVWEGVSLHSDRDRDAVKSWFGGLADDMTGPLKANVLTRTADDKTMKIRALFELPGGKRKELVRTFGDRFSIAIREPTKQRWA